MDGDWWCSQLDGACSHEMKTRLLLGRKARTNLGSVLKSRAMTLLTKVRLVKAVVSPVVMYGCESWTTEKAECRRIDALELCCWRRLLRVPWTARRSNQSILKDIIHDDSLEGWMLKLKLHYFGHLMWRAISPEKILMLGRLRAGWERGDRGWDGWMASLTQWNEFEQTRGDGEGHGSLVCCSQTTAGCKGSNKTEGLNNDP